MRSVLLFLIAFYRRFISPMLRPACRYLPTCSEYAEEAICVHGPWKGGYHAFRRLLRCHPFGGSGYDPVKGPSGNGRPG